jgi:glycosyltransferase involved in cell wall biosynthesis
MAPSIRMQGVGSWWNIWPAIITRTGPVNSNCRILVPCMDWTRPSGGVRKLYRHVDILNAAGMPAMILHQAPGFRASWFANETKVSSFHETPPGYGDVLLVPEILAWQFTGIAPGVPKIIFNQNAYQTFAWRQPQHAVVPYRHPDYLATIVVSDDNRQYLEHTFPGHRVLRIHHSVDPGLFYFQPAKKRQIALMPRKKDADMKQVLGLLRYRGKLDGFTVVEIQDKSEAETAEILRDSMIFLSFSELEGWGLPPMEAMACGCVTIGYDGRGGREFFREPYAIPIQPEDVTAFAAAVERAIADLKANRLPLSVTTGEASDFILSTYSPQREAQDVLQTWREILEVDLARFRRR